MAYVPGQADKDHKQFNLGLQMQDGSELPAFGSSMMPDLNHGLQECYINLGELVPTKYTFTAQDMLNPTFYQFLPGPSFEPVHQAWEGEIAGASFVFPDPNSSFVVPIMKSEEVDPACNPHQQQLLDQQQQRRESRKIKSRNAAARSEARRIAYVTELECQIEAYKEENSELQKKIEASNMGRMKEPSENTSSENSKIARSNSFEMVA